MCTKIVHLVLGAAIALTVGAQTGDVSKTAAMGADTIKFKVHRVGNFRSEACSVADFNKDGKLDIAAGEYLYLAPDWKAIKIRTIGGAVDESGKGYRHDFANISLDVDLDGLPDLVSVDWFDKQAVWFKNVGSTGGEWPMRIIHQNGNFEAADICDIEGKGQKTAIVPFVQQSIWCEVGTNVNGQATWLTHLISEKNMHFGAGVGDINKDGRPDLIRPNAWFEAPVDLRHGQWIEHSLALGEANGKATHTAQILIHDVNGDGLADIITSSAHGFGIFWYEQSRDNGQISFKQHLIDDTWSQAHSLALGDLDGDGVLELVTGKRFQAHNGNDPQEDQPLGVYYYKLHRTPNLPVTYRKHIVSYNEGIGSGMNICLADMNADGKLDIVVTGKWAGPVWFENRGM